MIQRIRRISANELAHYVVARRDELVKGNVISKEEPITLVGFSHGGNVAIIAADLIYKLTGLKVQIVTIATPAYNNYSSEDPATHSSISKHMYLYSEADAVDAIAGVDPNYNTKSTKNVRIPERIQPDTGKVQTHKDLANKNQNKKLGNFLKTLPALDKIRDFNKTREVNRGKGKSQE